MTREDKQILFIDLCARLPYGLVVNTGHGDLVLDEKHRGIGALYSEDCTDFSIVISGCYYGDNIMPYLRSMSKMTDEEEGMYNLLQGISNLSEQHWTADDGKVYRYADAMDWLNAHHFDYRGLIEKGLALEAPEGMYD